jgi:hypothetical protein
MRRVFAATDLDLGAANGFAAEPPPSARGPHPYAPLSPVEPRTFFAGKTVSGVIYLPVTGASSLATTMFEAYLGADGRASLRWWDSARGRYAPLQSQPWSVEGDRLCLRFEPVAAESPLCFTVHVWGPNFSGYRANGGMIKGDARPGRGAGL